jgi:hypothetical protein
MKYRFGLLFVVDFYSLFFILQVIGCVSRQCALYCKVSSRIVVVVVLSDFDIIFVNLIINGNFTVVQLVYYDATEQIVYTNNSILDGT